MSSTIFTGTSNRTIRVVAPATLEENFTFDVTLGDTGRRFSVTVPPGGVKEGEEFEIPYPPSDDEEEDQYSVEGKQRQIKEQHTVPSGSQDDDDDATSDSTTGAPYGRWRYPLCACCDVITQSTFWMAIFCAPVLLAQLVTRMGLAWNGKAVEDAKSTAVTTFGETNDEASLSFNRIVLSFAAILAVANLFPFVGWFIVAAYIFGITFFVGSNVRQHMRQRYKIPPSLKICKQNKKLKCVGPCLEDYLCMCCFGCCSLIQMARHTHNDKEYPGYCCTTTGLESGAPSIV
jgi:Cys-rich protein (TIGR01571 family)